MFNCHIWLAQGNPNSGLKISWFLSHVIGGFHTHGDTTIAGWFMSWNTCLNWMIWEYPYLGNLQLYPRLCSSVTFTPCTPPYLRWASIQIWNPFHGQSLKSHVPHKHYPSVNNIDPKVQNLVLPIKLAITWEYTLISPIKIIKWDTYIQNIIKQQ